MKKDMTVACDEGFINIRVGAIIKKDGKFLMVGNDRADYHYSVGGRVQFGETAEEAVYPEFFRTELLHPEEGVKHFVTDERLTK